jgi:hypothetical protein
MFPRMVSTLYVGILISSFTLFEVYFKNIMFRELALSPSSGD